MSVASGPPLISNGLMLCIDPANVNNFNTWSNAYYTNGSFQGGQNVTQEGGSNPTNEIITFLNPGGSAWVLRQTGTVAYTEYQISLTSQLVSSTTYTMSGWYAQSSDYSCADGSRMFHARAYSSSGAHNATGVGIGTTIASVVINGITWQYCYQQISTPADYSNAFDWYVGYGGSAYTGYRYYTNLKLDKGNFPALIDESNNGHYTVSYGNIGFSSANAGTLTYDGSTSYNLINDSSLLSSTSALTIDVWINSTDIVTRINDIVGKGSSDADEEYCLLAGTGFVYFDVGPGSGPYTQPSYTFANNTWYNITAVHSRTAGTSTCTVYVNGTALSSSTIGATNTPGDNTVPVSVGRRFYNTDPNSRTFNGKMGPVRIYNTALTASNILQNFNAVRGRYGV